MSKHLDTEIQSLKNKLFSLMTVVEECLQYSLAAVLERDEKKAREVIERDDKIDDLEVEIEEDCLKILALHQPVAIDLRFIIAAMKMNNDLERIGDLTVNIAERAIFLSKHPPIESPFDFKTMATKTRSMLKNAIDSLIYMDVNLAKKVCKDDDEVDSINREMYTKMFAAIKQNPNQVEALLQYLSTSRHVERIADYATNIAEDVIYMVEGSIVRHRPEVFK